MDAPSEDSPSADIMEGNGLPGSSSTLPIGGSGESPHDVDKQERIERFVRMSIQNQAESMLAQTSSDVSML